ncbi:hypothetical protein [Streptomyces sp. NPDC029674]|uniref:hypothetical protein n=1 Tax=Streptomyces sp. NPDC029674 TaxID=3365297 RepID=UPI00384CC038
MHMRVTITAAALASALSLLGATAAHAYPSPPDRPSLPEVEVPDLPGAELPDLPEVKKPTLP